MICFTNKTYVEWLFFLLLRSNKKTITNLKKGMSTSIKKTESLAPDDNLVVIGEQFKDRPEYFLAEKEKKYILEQLSQNKKLIVLNQLGRIFIWCSIDKKKAEAQVLESLRISGSKICTVLNEIKAQSITVLNNFQYADYSLALAEGLALSNYQFIHHKKNAEKEKNSLQIVSLFQGKLKDKQIDELNCVIEATCIARDLVNEPVNYLNASALSQKFVELAKKVKIKVEVFDKKKIEQLKMGGLLAVNKGSVDPPTFTVMEYKPKDAKNKKPYVLIGKGLVYDTGGLSLKSTPNSMDQMKCDMAGGAAAGCAIYAIAKAKLPVHVISLIPSTDNRPSFNAFAPGDIITMYNGMTVEMLNSDAEGRMILADALSYADKYSPELVIDLATLTGAAAAAIGAYGIVSMGTAGEKYQTKLAESGNRTYERLAPLPFWDEYDELLHSDIADMKNIGGPIAGAITAGRFLKKFTNAPYIHLDIAGPAFIMSKDNYKTKGGTGSGVRLLFDFFKNIKK